MLLDRAPNGICPLLRDMEDHIRQQGLADMLANAEAITSDSEKYVEQLLDMFNRFSGLVRDAFDDDPRFLTSRDKVTSGSQYGIDMGRRSAYVGKVAWG